MEVKTISPLLQVVTKGEAAKLYGCSTSSIEYHLEKGNLTFRQTEAGHIIIDLASLNRLHIRIYGKPLVNPSLNPVQKSIR